MTDPTERLRDALDRLADQAPLEYPDGPPARPSRRRRRLGRPALAVAVLAVAALIVVGIVAVNRPSGNHVIMTGPLAGTPVDRPSTDLAILARGQARIVNAITGKTVRSVKVRDLGGYAEQLSAAPGGKIVYAVISPYMCSDSRIVSINMTDGRVTTLLRHALNVALSPDGRLLAYTRTVTPPKRFGEPQSCATGETYVRSLASGATQAWNITTHPTGDLAAELVTSLTWASDNAHLVLTMTGGGLPASLVRVLDVDEPLSGRNPVAVGGKVAYSSPVLLPDHHLMGVVEDCPNNQSCPFSLPAGSVVNTVRVVSGQILSSFKVRHTVVRLLVDPSGRRVEMATSHSHDTLTLGELRGHRVSRTFTITDLDVFCWIPRLP